MVCVMAHSKNSWHIAPLDPLLAPWPLLLDADPSRSKVRAYLPRSICFAAHQGAPEASGPPARIFGVCVLVPLGEQAVASAWELMNIAVAVDQQRRGIGRALLLQAIAWARYRGAQQLEVGTGSFGDPLRFYQRQGFRVRSVVPDFFLTHYPEPLFEQGLQHRDMLRLVLPL